MPELQPRINECIARSTPCRQAARKPCGSLERCQIVAANVCARAGEGVSADVVAAGGVQLPPPADLLAICRRGVRAPRPLGRRLDDARPPAALPAIRHLRPRLRAQGTATRRTLVPAVALRPLARHQYDTAAAISLTIDAATDSATES